MKREAAALLAAISMLALHATTARAESVSLGRGISVDLPSGWIARPGFGRTFALFEGEGVSVRLLELGAAKGNGVVAVEPIDPSCELSILCRDADGSLAKSYLVCRELADKIRCADSRKMRLCPRGGVTLKEIPTPSSLERLSSAPDVARGIFAILDGRSGCPGEVDLDSLAKRLGCRIALEGDLRSIFEAMSLEREGRDASAEEIYDGLARKYNGFFARLALARLRSDRGEVEAAIESMRGLGRDGALSSNMMTALDLRLARIYGDVEMARRLFLKMDGEICGLSGAIAAYEMGLLSARDDPDRAIEFFERAIAARPDYTAPYLSMAGALLDAGSTPAEASDRIVHLLEKAPSGPEIDAIAERFRKLARKVR